MPHDTLLGRRYFQHIHSVTPSIHLYPSTLPTLPTLPTPPTPPLPNTEHVPLTRKLSVLRNAKAAEQANDAPNEYASGTTANNIRQLLPLSNLLPLTAYRPAVSRPRGAEVYWRVRLGRDSHQAWAWAMEETRTKPPSTPMPTTTQLAARPATTSKRESPTKMSSEVSSPS